jgi:hypothetical protein
MARKKDIKLNKGIAFRTDNNGSYMVEEVELTFTPKDIRLIKKSINFCNKNKSVFSVKVDFDNYTFLEDDGKIAEEWRSDSNSLIIYSDSVYFYSQSKYDAGDQLETEEISLKELGLE